MKENLLFVIIFTSFCACSSAGDFVSPKASVKEYAQILVEDADMQDFVVALRQYKDQSAAAIVSGSRVLTLEEMELIYEQPDVAISIYENAEYANPEIISATHQEYVRLQRQLRLKYASLPEIYSRQEQEAISGLIEASLSNSGTPPSSLLEQAEKLKNK